MRLRGIVVVMAAFMAVTLNAHAAQPDVFVSAVQSSDHGLLLLNSSTKSFVYKPASGPAVNATVKCLQISGAIPSSLTIVPPAIVPINLRIVGGRAVAGGKTYYFGFGTVGPGGLKNVHAALFSGVSKKSASSSYCGAGSVDIDVSAGVAIYR
jgi:hypothetical protein